MLTQYGIAAEKLNPKLSEQEGYCGSLKSWRNEENVKDNLVQPGVLGQRHYCAQFGLDGQRLEQPHLFGRRLG